MITERGYHLMYPKKAHLINRPIGIGKFGFYFTPMEDGLRVAGTVEIGSNSKNLNTKRIKWMEKKTEETLFSINPNPHPTRVFSLF